MRCEETMKRDVHCCRQDDTLQMVARMMRDENIGFVPVCDHDKPIGAVTDRDMAIRACADGMSPTTTKVSQVMTREVIRCKPTDDVEKAEAMMSKNHKSRIMVCDDGGKLVGVISLSDMVEQMDDAHAAGTMRQISERETRPHA